MSTAARRRTSACRAACYPHDGNWSQLHALCPQSHSNARPLGTPRSTPLRWAWASPSPCACTKAHTSQAALYPLHLSCLRSRVPSAPHLPCTSLPVYYLHCHCPAAPLHLGPDT